MRAEVFKGRDKDGAHRSGSEGAAFAILGYSAAAYVAYASAPSVFTGFLLGVPPPPPLPCASDSKPSSPASE